MVNPAEGHIPVPVVAWGRGSAGVAERGMYARVVQEPGRSRLLHREGGGAGAANEVVQALGEIVRLRGSEEGEAVVAPSEGDEARREGRREVGVGG